MGVGNSVPEEIRGNYKEEIEEKIDETHKMSYEYKLVLKEETFELVVTHMKMEKKGESGLSMKFPHMSMYWGNVEEKGDMSKGEPVKLKFTTTKASAAEKESSGGICLPNDNYRTDFQMRYEKADKIEEGVSKGTFHCVVFETYPKMKLEKLTGRLFGKKITK